MYACCVYVFAYPLLQIYVNLYFLFSVFPRDNTIFNLVVLGQQVTYMLTLTRTHTHTHAYAHLLLSLLFQFIEMRRRDRHIRRAGHPWAILVTLSKWLLTINKIKGL